MTTRTENLCVWLVVIALVAMLGVLMGAGFAR